MLGITGEVGEFDVSCGQSLLEGVDLLLNLSCCCIKSFPGQLEGVDLIVEVLDAGIQLSVCSYGVTGIASGLGIELAVIGVKTAVGGLSTDSADETPLSQFLCVVGKLCQLSVGRFEGGLEGSKLGDKLS